MSRIKHLAAVGHIYEWVERFMSTLKEPQTALIAYGRHQQAAAQRLAQFSA
jgi:hypothetical protein